ncbi:Serine/threonine-protein kinase UCNL [Heracleum sosnowskyi]|uniref:non-specific serine/threonine protein kinase n=1 Tax=Heracleum sosnowskyi TaxID=360622 RepID=A0AAD8M1B7_9APIA|nr:Serine/threonine-protein kinase UCNL [Heracleum sosnowskyi]
MDTQVSPELHLNHFRALKVLGKGATGTVFLVHHLFSDPSATSPFALKVVEKSPHLDAKVDTDRRARWELSLLRRLNNSPSPFLPTLLGSFETNDLIGWAIPFCPGGDLNVLRYNQSDHIFSPTVIRFYIAEIICALEKLHALGIVYRDLKPENILIQQSGHLTLTDFDLSRTLIKSTRPLDVVYEPEPTKQKSSKKTKNARVAPVSKRKLSLTSNGERANSFVGTEEYISPEVVRGDGHEFAVDWWALGVLAFEMLYGTTPFRGKNKKDTFRRIVMMQPEFIGRQSTLTDLIGKLLEKEPTRRLGYRRGACEIKEHPFFHGLRWDLLTELSRPPFLPSRELPELKGNKSVDIREYFEKLRMPPLSLDSPVREECLNNVSLTEF